MLAVVEPPDNFELDRRRRGDARRGERRRARSASRPRPPRRARAVGVEPEQVDPDRRHGRGDRQADRGGRGHLLPGARRRHRQGRAGAARRRRSPARRAGAFPIPIVIVPGRLCGRGDRRARRVRRIRASRRMHRASASNLADRGSPEDAAQRRCTEALLQQRPTHVRRFRPRPALNRCARRPSDVHPDRSHAQSGDPEVPARPSRHARRHVRCPRRRRAPRASPLAERLFAMPGVTGVFFGYDFITVTKARRANGST